MRTMAWAALADLGWAFGYLGPGTHKGDMFSAGIFIMALFVCVAQDIREIFR